MAVITVAREVGSGGHSIAAALAARLGYQLFDRHALRHEAERCGLSLPATFEQFAREDRLVVATRSGASTLYVSYGELEFDRAIMGRGAEHATTESRSFLDILASQQRDILLALHAVVYHLAATDRVIFVGAGAQLLLAGLPGVLRTKIVASQAVRAERLTSGYGVKSEDAVEAILRADQEQRDYNTIIFGADWDDPLMWDVVVNTNQMTVETASQWVSSLVSRSPLGDPLSAGTRAALSAASELNRRLWSDATFRSAAIIAVPCPSAVALRGDLVPAAIHDDVLLLASSIVTDVDLLDDMALTNGGKPSAEW
jgi:cytidylate kinase